jgi:hypothetical protein
MLTIGTGLPLFAAALSVEENESSAVGVWDQIFRAELGSDWYDQILLTSDDSTLLACRLQYVHGM